MTFCKDCKYSKKLGRGRFDPRLDFELYECANPSYKKIETSKITGVASYDVSCSFIRRLHDDLDGNCPGFSPKLWKRFHDWLRTL